MPVHVFTDGACEPSPTGALEGTIGGVLLDAPNGKYEYFMATIRPEMMERLQRLSANPICQVELLAVLASLCLWRFSLADRPAVVWVDNEATRAALIKACSSQAHVAEILAVVTRLETSTQCRCWFERVPSASNVADPPSRGIVPPALLGMRPTAAVLDWCNGSFG